MNKITRRQFLTACGVAGAAGMLTACGGKSNSTAGGSGEM
ncbi:MAG: twin-arginine translocation signal domain-containing protein, partial [Faecalibacterium sp.]|nr:twin-arginine translocation signal domain-containing protein [Faecalibacterium sp.]